MEHIKDKIILVTGGCGSIGSALVKELLTYQPKMIKVLDNNETALHDLNQELKQHKSVRYLIGDVRDKSRLNRAALKTDIIFHVAALKHVPLCEYNPLDAVTTNVIGTANIIDAARDQGVSKVVYISTDKAVSPYSTMGATKLLSEKLILNADMFGFNTKFALVRFGNVMNSRGSVIPLFKNQIKNGKSLTITSNEMTRFIMSITDAVKLVIRAADLMTHNDMFILKMKAINIVDLATAMIKMCDQKELSLEYIGIRPGEKLYEALMSEEEAAIAKDLGDMFHIQYEPEAPHCVEPPKQITPLKLSEYHSSHAPKLTETEIVELLKNSKIC